MGSGDTSGMRGGDGRKERMSSHAGGGESGRTLGSARGRGVQAHGWGADVAGERRVGLRHGSAHVCGFEEHGAKVLVV